MTITTLRTLASGQTATITAVTATGELGRRIREMGIIPGTSVTISGRAPLNDPVALRIGGNTIALRNNEADCIFIEAAQP
jgi:ferrous iron transport protein A